MQMNGYGIVATIKSVMQGRFQFALFLMLSCSVIHAQVANPSLPVGIVIPNVICSANLKQSYALYLPSNFSSGRKWPILYMFDPAARGQLAVETAREAAEKFGYILVASNNSRNGLMGGTEQAAEAVWRDTQQRFPIDERRRYTAGMSGGARVATGMALGCAECFAGVVANAAGFPGHTIPTRDMKFAYFAAVGDADFNYPEFVVLRKKLDEVGARYRIRLFEGEHGWAPSEIWIEALNWLDLQGMKSGALARDEKRVQASLNEEIAHAQELRKKGDLLAAQREYQSVVRDFASLDDVSSTRNALAELEQNKGVKKAEKDEADAVSQQAYLTEDASRQMQSLPDGMLAQSLAQARTVILDLKKKTGNAADPHDSKVLIMRRALGGLVVQAFESAQTSIDLKKYDEALLYFDLAAAGSRHPEWIHYQRARVYALKSDKKGVIAELKQAVTGGFNDPSAIELAEFYAYRDLPEFQNLIAQIKSKNATTPQ
jgi:tetratricopeptide (TPR) repeat protein